MTGGSTGIGRAIAEALAQQGLNVVVQGLEPGEGIRQATEIVWPICSFGSPAQNSGPLRQRRAEFFIKSVL